MLISLAIRLSSPVCPNSNPGVSYFRVSGGGVPSKIVGYGVDNTKVRSTIHQSLAWFQTFDPMKLALCLV